MSDTRDKTGPGGTLRINEPEGFRAEIVRAIRQNFAPRLVVIAGPDVGMRFRLDGTITLGRGAGADAVLTDASVSTTHVRIEDRGDAWAIVDLGSTNGTRVDGERVGEALLTHHAKVQIGTTTLRFEIQDEKDQAYDALVERLISLDDLTGLYQRRRFDRELGAVLARGEPVALLVMDLDGIKRINDTHGHLFGAHVIGEAGRRIVRLLADVEGAFGARFGGDEYTVAAPRLDRFSARTLAERLRHELADAAYTMDGIELRVGASIGIAIAPDDAPDLPTLFQQADARMYEAKRAGKNRVCG